MNNISPVGLRPPLRIADLSLSDGERCILMNIRSRPEVSRAELVATLGLSKAMLSKAVKKFLDLGLVTETRETPKERRVGQPALRLQINNESLEFIGINLSSRGCYAAVTDFLGHPKWVSPGMAWSGEIENVKVLLDQALAHTHDRAEVGLYIPGLLTAGGKIHEITPNQQHIPFQEIADYLRTHYPEHPLNIGQSDILFQALRPENFGKVIMHVSLNDDLDGQIFDRDRIFQGGFNQAGNIGGLVPETGPRPSLQDLANFIGCKMDHLTVQRLRQMYNDKNPKLIEWIADRASHLSQPFSAVTQLINPNKIIIGGNFPREILQDLADRVSLSFYDLPNRKSLTKPQIEIAETIGEKARAITAAALPIARFLNWKS